MRVTRADAALALEKHEPLRPVAKRILISHHAQQHIAYRLDAIQGEQQLDRALAHIPCAPTPTGELLQTSRREVVNQRVLSEPRHDFRESPQSISIRIAGGGLQG